MISNPAVCGNTHKNNMKVNFCSNLRSLTLCKHLHTCCKGAELIRCQKQPHCQSKTLNSSSNPKLMQTCSFIWTDQTKLTVLAAYYKLFRSFYLFVVSGWEDPPAHNSICLQFFFSKQIFLKPDFIDKNMFALTKYDMKTLGSLKVSKEILTFDSFISLKKSDQFYCLLTLISHHISYTSLPAHCLANHRAALWCL